MDERPNVLRNDLATSLCAVWPGWKINRACCVPRVAARGEGVVPSGGQAASPLRTCVTAWRSDGARAGLRRRREATDALLERYEVIGWP